MAGTACPALRFTFHLARNGNRNAPTRDSRHPLLSWERSIGEATLQRGFKSCSGRTVFSLHFVMQTACDFSRVYEATRVRTWAMRGTCLTRASTTIRNNNYAYVRTYELSQCVKCNFRYAILLTWIRKSTVTLRVLVLSLGVCGWYFLDTQAVSEPAMKTQLRSDRT